MKTIYILSQGACLRRVGRRLILEKDKKRIFEVPLKDVGRILIYGNTEITSQTLMALMDDEIPLCYARRSGDLRGRLLSSNDGHVRLRMLQHRYFSDDRFALPMSRNFIQAKLHNMETVIEYIFRKGEGTQSLCAPLREAAQKLQGCRNRDEIMGTEGAAARHYFKIYGESLPEFFRFTVRSRRPALDPANALLNLGYMTILREVLTHLEAHHLDPYLGILHATQDGRPSLALDLMEEFRQPFVDILVLKGIRRGSIVPKHFESDQGYVKITPQGMETFFRLYEEVMGMKDGENPGWRKAIDEQVSLLKKHLLGEGSYRPFLLELEREDKGSVLS